MEDIVFHTYRDCYQTPTNSKETHRGDHGHLGPIPRSTTNLERHLERTMGVTMVGRNGFTQIRRGSMDSGTQNSESLPRRDNNLGPPYHEISKRGPLNTIGTGVTNSMSSPHRSYKTRSKDDWKHHPILTSLSRTREPYRKQTHRMINLSTTTHGNMKYMLSRLSVMSGLSGN
jgi:hypothetical protein